MKQFSILILGLTITCLSFGQTAKFQAGTSFSKLDWELAGINTEPLYEESLIGYSVFAGLDYMEKKYFNLSSNLGFLRKGGIGEIHLTDENGELTGETITGKPSLDYLSINTLFEVKYQIKKITPFIGFGPRIDFLINSSDQFDGLKEIDELNGMAAGLILGGGVKYDLDKLQFGVRADYYLDFTKISEWTIEVTSIEGEISTKVFTINLTAGFKL